MFTVFVWTAWTLILQSTSQNQGENPKSENFAYILLGGHSFENCPLLDAYIYF